MTDTPGPRAGPEPSAREVFEILVRDHADQLLTFARAIVSDRSSAEDVFQETLIVAWRRLPDFDRSRPFGPWLRGIARNVALDLGSRRRMAVADPSIIDAIEGHAASFESTPAAAWRDRFAELDECLARLPAPFAEVVQLTYAGGSPLSKVAEALSLAEETVKKRLQRARAMLAECLEAKGVLA